MILKENSTHFKPAPEGVHNAVCVDVTPVKVYNTPWGEKEKFRLVWELEATMEDGRRFLVTKAYVPSIHPKSTLRKDLKAWRGRDFTPDELNAFDTEKIVGAPCQLVISHNEKDDQVYANIAAIMKADKNKKLTPSGKYVRVQDRDQKQNGNGKNGHVERLVDTSVMEEPEFASEEIPF